MDDVQGGLLRPIAELDGGSGDGVAFRLRTFDSLLNRNSRIELAVFKTIHKRKMRGNEIAGSASVNQTTRFSVVDADSSDEWLFKPWKRGSRSRTRVTFGRDRNPFPVDRPGRGLQFRFPQGRVPVRPGVLDGISLTYFVDCRKSNLVEGITHRFRRDERNGIGHRLLSRLLQLWAIAAEVTRFLAVATETKSICLLTRDFRLQFLGAGLSGGRRTFRARSWAVSGARESLRGA